MNIPSHVVVDDAALSMHISQSLPRQVSLRSGDVHWILPESGLFCVEIDGIFYSAQSPDLIIETVHAEVCTPLQHRTRVTFHHPTARWCITWVCDVFVGTNVIETWLEITNQHDTNTIRVARMDAWDVLLPVGSYETMAYTGAWGSEFEPIRQRLIADIRLEGRAGRSSQGMHPMVTLWRDGRVAMQSNVVWSGNWSITLTENAHGAFRMQAGISPWAFWSDIPAQGCITAPAVASSFATDGSVDTLAQQLATVGRNCWYPHNRLSDALPVEWNHWWTYEDRAINEATFRANVDVAATMGFEVCVVDAGWFGPSDANTHWYDYRGDWHLVNAQRFPAGMRALSDYVHAKGMAFGIWCEVEALGVRAEIAQTHPDVVALRDGVPAGYVCLGSHVGWEHAFATLDRIITEYNADWIKLDFNLDPGAGCNRTDHGHGAGDGLYTHYQGYYRLLAAIRAKHPEVILENCSSGGLRIDLGIAKQTHMAFLSDPDWPEHSLQLFWGASTMLAPNAILHWSFGEWGFADHPQQTFDPRDPALILSQLDYYTRVAMLHRLGFSLALPDLPAWVAQRIQQHIADYQHVVRRFVADGQLYRLTNQPRRDGTWDRYAGFQFVVPNQAQMLLCFFRMPDAKAQKRFYLADIDATASYRCTWLGESRSELWSGVDLQAGMLVSDLAAPGAAFILCERL